MLETSYLAKKRHPAILLMLCLLAPMAFGQLKYNTTLLTHSVGSPSGLAVADFNRDGRPDIALVHGNVVSVLFNQSAGNFGPSVDTPLTAGTVSVQALAADVNNDGKVDLVIAQSQ